MRPSPSRKQGKALSVSLRTGVVYGLQYFRRAEQEISSYDFSASPKIAFNAW